jgi:hypothetical protein
MSWLSKLGFGVFGNNTISQAQETVDDCTNFPVTLHIATSGLIGNGIVSESIATRGMLYGNGCAQIIVKAFLFIRNNILHGGGIR